MIKTILRSVLFVLVGVTMASAQGNRNWHAAFPGVKIAGK
jgi:hypothetical protein